MFNQESTRVNWFKPPISPVLDERGQVKQKANQNPNGSLTIYQVYRTLIGEWSVSNSDLKGLTEALRNISDPDPKREHDLGAEFKKLNLPFITFGGLFSYRKRDKLTEASGLLCLDIDGKDQSPKLTEDDIPPLRQRLSEDSELSPVLLFRSPLGKGLKVVVKLRQEIRDDEDFKRAYLSLEYYLRTEHHIITDPSGKDITRSCFLCYDPEAVLLEAGDGFDIEKWTPPQPEPETPRQTAPAYQRPLGETMGLTGGPSDFERAVVAVEDIERSGINVADDYRDWRDFGFALSELGEQGRELYHRVSRCASNYDPEGTDRHFTEALSSSYSGPRIHLETLFKRAGEMGVRMRSSSVYQRPAQAPEHRGNREQVPPPEAPIGPDDYLDGPVIREAQEPSPKWLLDPTTETEVIERESSLPEALPTGYEVKGEQGFRQKLLLLSGKLTTIAGATGHGKTLFLMNLLLNVSRLRPDKRFILLTYEENQDTILEYLLNIYLKDLNLMRGGDWRSNRILIKEYFSGQGTDNINPAKVPEFNERKALFFKKYIETGRILIKYIDSDSTDLCRKIKFLSAPENNIGGVFIDYFQCINPAQVDRNGRPQRFPTRQEALKSICFELKDVANETGLPVVLACQFNQEVLSPTDVLLNRIGEAGDISRIVSECWGLWQMGKDIGRSLDKTDKEKADALERDSIGIQLATGDNFLKGMYLKVLKSRIVETGSEGMFEFRGLTGKIYPNDPDETEFNCDDWNRPDPELPSGDDNDLPL